MLDVSLLAHQASVEDAFGEIATVARLLSAEAASEQRCVAQLEESRRCESARGRDECSMDRLGGGQRDLLFEDDLNQRREPWRSAPERGRTEASIDLAEVLIASRQPLAARPTRLGIQDERHGAPGRQSTACLRPTN